MAWAMMNCLLFGASSLEMGGFKASLRRICLMGEVSGSYKTPSAYKYGNELVKVAERSPRGGWVECGELRGGDSYGATSEGLCAVEGEWKNRRVWNEMRK